MGSDIYLCYKKSMTKSHFLAYKPSKIHYWCLWGSVYLTLLWRQKCCFICRGERGRHLGKTQINLETFWSCDYKFILFSPYTACSSLLSLCIRGESGVDPKPWYCDQLLFKSQTSSSNKCVLLCSDIRPVPFEGSQRCGAAPYSGYVLSAPWCHHRVLAG